MKQGKWISYGICIFLLCGCSSSNKKVSTIPYAPELSANVKDLSAPEILCDNEYSIMINEDFDIKKKLSVKDNLDEKPKVTINGNYDNSKAGTYEITIIAKDIAGNTSNKKVTLIVKEKKVPKPQQPNKETEPSKNNQVTQPNTKPSTPLPVPVTPGAPEKDFLFKEGQSSTDTYKECMVYGISLVNAAQANSVSCEVIQSNGLEIGYHSYFN